MEIPNELMMPDMIRTCTLPETKQSAYDENRSY